MKRRLGRRMRCHSGTVVAIALRTAGSLDRIDVPRRYVAGGRAQLHSLKDGRNAQAHYAGDSAGWVCPTGAELVQSGPHRRDEEASPRAVRIARKEVMVRIVLKSALSDF